MSFRAPRIPPTPSPPPHPATPSLPCCWLGTAVTVLRTTEIHETQKGSNEHLFILTRTHSMQIFGEIPFIKPQNAAPLRQQINGQKRWKRKEKDLFWFSFYSLFGAWKSFCFSCLLLFLFCFVVVFFAWFFSPENDYISLSTAIGRLWEFIKIL